MANHPGSGMATGVGDSNTPDRGDTPHLQFELGAEPHAVRETLTALGQRLRDFDVPEPRIDDAQITLAEVLNNIVEHSYADQPGGIINVDLWISPGDVACLIRDTGASMPMNRLPSAPPPDIQNTDVQDLPEGGFGWLLIREMTSALRYRRIGDENHLFFRVGSEAP